jgi:hypothetical protein
MTVLSVLGAVGRRRSPATLPGYHAGRPPRTRASATGLTRPPSMRSSPWCATPPRTGTDGGCARCWLCSGAGRIHEALALAEHDLDARRGSVLVRHGKGGRRREVGMLDWAGSSFGRGWSHARTAGRAAVLHHRRTGPRGTVVAPPSARVPAARGRGWRQAPLRVASAAPRARARARARGRAAEHHPAPARAHESRHHEHLPAGHRSRGNHHGTCARAAHR